MVERRGSVDSSETRAFVNSRPPSLTRFNTDDTCSMPEPDTGQPGRTSKDTEGFAPRTLSAMEATTMDTARARKIRMDRHARRLACGALKRAGTRKAVGKALGYDYSTVGHKVSDRPDATVLDYFTALLYGTDTDALPVLEAMQDAFELHAVVMADTPDLIRDGLALMEGEPTRDAEEDNAGIIGPIQHAEALERYRPYTTLLPLIIRELAERGVDLHALYREAHR